MWEKSNLPHTLPTFWPLHCCSYIHQIQPSQIVFRCVTHSNLLVLCHVGDTHFFNGSNPSCECIFAKCSSYFMLFSVPSRKYSHQQCSGCRHTIFLSVETLNWHGFQHWGLCIRRDSDDHVNVGPVTFNGGRKRTTEDDMHPGSDHPQCQHKKV